MGSKRERCVNWDTDEKELLKDILKEFMNVINDKSCNTSVLNGRKKEAWDQIGIKFNALNRRMRTVEQIKAQWKSMKLERKRKSLAGNKETDSNDVPISQYSSVEDHELAYETPPENIYGSNEQRMAEINELENDADANILHDLPMKKKGGPGHPEMVPKTSSYNPSDREHWSAPEYQPTTCTDYTSDYSTNQMSLNYSENQSLSVPHSSSSTFREPSPTNQSSNSGFKKVAGDIYKIKRSQLKEEHILKINMLKEASHKNKEEIRLMLEAARRSYAKHVEEMKYLQLRNKKEEIIIEMLNIEKKIKIRELEILQKISL